MMGAWRARLRRFPQSGWRMPEKETAASVTRLISVSAGIGEDGERVGRTGRVGLRRANKTCYTECRLFPSDARSGYVNGI